MHTFKKLIVLPVLLASCAPGVFGQGSETFNTSSSTTTDGWTGVGTTANGNNFGWSGTHYCNPTNAGAAGEGGGLLSFNGTEDYFGVSAGGVMTLANVFHAQGQMALTNNVPPDNFFAGIGYFLAADAGGYAVTNFIGLSIQEPAGSAPNANAYRAEATIIRADGVNRSSSTFYLTPGNTNYTWSMDFDPTQNRLLVEVYDSTGALVGSATLTPNPADLGTNISVDSFGLVTGGARSEPYDTNATAGVFIDNVQYTLAGAAACTQVSPLTTSAALGTSSQTVTLTMASSLPSDEYFTITSANSSIAVPAGAINGSLTLDIPAGSTVGTFTVTGLGIGTTSFDITDTNAVCVDSAVGISVVAAPLPTVTNCEYFTTSNSAAADGFVELNSRSAVDNYGWDNSSYCGDAAGEAGGNFGNPTTQSSYAVDFPSPLGFNDDVSASGLFTLTSAANNMDVRIGHFSAGTALGSAGASYVGLQVNEPSPGSGNQGRIYALIVCPDGTTTRSSQAVPVFAGQVYPWSYTYDPDAGALTANFTVSGTPVSVTATLTAAQRAQTASLTAFGLVNAQLANPAISDPGTLYIDDVCYTESLPCIFASPETLTTTVGVNTNIISVNVPAAANASHSFNVTVTSTATNVAVPTGAVNGALTLTFPAGNTNSQTFTVSALSPGSATFVLQNASNVCVSGNVSIYVEPSAYIKYEPFNTASSAQADGWVGYNMGVTETNQTTENGYAVGLPFTVSYGWSNNSYCGDAAGEAGGIFDNPGVPTYYADVFSPASLPTTNGSPIIMATGQYAIAARSLNLNTYLGHFSTTSLTPSSGTANGHVAQIGIGIAEFNLNNDGRMYAYASYGDGTSTKSPTASHPSQFAPQIGQVYNWGYTFNPSSGSHGVLVVGITNASSGVFTNATVTLTKALPAMNAFGWVTPAYTATNNPTNSEQSQDPGADYIDNVNYTVPQPALAFTTISRSGGTTQVTFLTPLPGVTPVLQQSSSLRPTNWSNVSGVTYNTNLGTYTVGATFPTPSSSKFYRVVLP